MNKPLVGIGQMPKKLTRGQIAEAKRNLKRLQKQMKDEQWFETFRLVFIASGALSPDQSLFGSFRSQLDSIEHRARIITDRIESIRPKRAEYHYIPAIYAGE